MARIHLAGLGTRIFYTQHGGYDTHPKLMQELSGAIADFLDDLAEHNAADDVTILVFTEFGRRMRDNGSGTDHGSGGGAYIFGNRVRGGLYGQYPSLDPADWEHGEDLQHTLISGASTAPSWNSGWRLTPGPSSRQLRAAIPVPNNRRRTRETKQ